MVKRAVKEFGNRGIIWHHRRIVNIAGLCPFAAFDAHAEVCMKHFERVGF